MSSIARIIDANVNRAREALRVMEDAARFALDDAELCGELKALRHELRAAIDLLPLPEGVLEANRDTPHDVGTQISTDAEMHREGLLDVVIAAGKRLTESLRVIEEMSKVLVSGQRLSADVADGADEIERKKSAPSATSVDSSDRSDRFHLPAESSRRIESLRYRAYDLDSRLQLRFGAGRPRNWKLCLILTKSLCKRPWREVLSAAIVGGCDCVQVREKEIDGGELVRHVKEVRACAKPRAAAVSIIVNDRVDVALAAGADGVHLGQYDLSVRDARRLAGRTLLIGVSTHDLNEAKAAVEAGADYCGVGAMFATSLKPHRKPSGPEYLKSFIERYPATPHLAIGGITPGNVHELYEAGARGIAVSSAICAADDPAQVTRQLLGHRTRAGKLKPQTNTDQHGLISI